MLFVYTAINSHGNIEIDLPQNALGQNQQEFPWFVKMTNY